MNNGCACCGGVKFDSEGTMLCGNCLLALRDEFGIRIFKDGTILYRLEPKRWVRLPWKAKPRPRK